VSERQELTAALTAEMPRYISAALRFQVAVAHQLGMPVTDVHAVAALLEDGPMSVRELADLMAMTTGAVTRLVDRLEHGGYVRREPDHADRRRVVVQTVPERVGEIASYYEGMDARWKQELDRYSDVQLRFLLEFLGREREHTRTETVNLRAQGKAHGARRRRSTEADARSPG
jgi:DNA-binding MarR family transcriptional regulator